MSHYYPHSLGLLTASGEVAVPAPVLATNINPVTTTDASGAATTLSRAVQSISPAIDWSTESIDTVLGLLLATGDCIGPANTIRGLTAYFERRKSCRDEVVGVNDHSARTMLAGFVTPLQLTGSRTETVRITGQADGIVDGSGNRSIVLSDQSALPTILAAALSQYVVGAVRVANVVMEDTQRLSLGFGNEPLEKDQELGGLEPETAGTRRHSPVLSAGGTNLRKVGAGQIEILGSDALHTNTEVWLKRRKPGGGGLHDTTEPVHARLTISGLALANTAGAASGGGRATTDFLVESIDDGVNAPLTWTPNIQFNPGY